ncbi:MAG TPA: hypothetical protein VFH73_04420 [Polyangia bacterium]|nr:hypothetical protein [Polyangia bacterium]
MALELRHSVVFIEREVHEPPPGDLDVTVTTVRCSDDVASIEVYDPTSQRTVSRTISLDEADRVAWPHLLGLAVVELVLASWADVQSTPAATTDRQPPASITKELKAEDRNSPGRMTERGPSRRDLLGMFSVVKFAQAPILVGGDVRFTGRLSNRFRWSTDLSAHHGAQRTPLGNVYADLASVRGATLVEIASRLVALQGSLGLRLGVASLQGSPASDPAIVGGVVRGFWASPSLLSAVVLRLSERMILGVDLEGGWNVFPVVAHVQGQPSVAIHRAWLRGSIGIGMLL